MDKGYCGVSIQHVKSINNGRVKCFLAVEDEEFEGQMDLVVACKCYTSILLANNLLFYYFQSIHCKYNGKFNQSRLNCFHYFSFVSLVFSFTSIDSLECLMQTAFMVTQFNMVWRLIIYKQMSARLLYLKIKEKHQLKNASWLRHFYLKTIQFNDNIHIPFRLRSIFFGPFNMYMEKTFFCI